MDLAQFQCDVRTSELFTDPAETADAFADQLDTVITKLLHRHCRLQKRSKLAPKRLEIVGCQLKQCRLSAHADDSKGNGDRPRTLLVTPNIVKSAVPPIRPLSNPGATFIDNVSTPLKQIHEKGGQRFVICFIRRNRRRFCRPMTANV